MCLLIGVKRLRGVAVAMVGRREVYRKDVEGLVDSQNRDLPVCPVDGEPCLTPERQIVWFGVMASDGVEEIECFCSRFKAVKKK